MIRLLSANDSIQINCIPYAICNEIRLGLALSQLCQCLALSQFGSHGEAHSAVEAERLHRCAALGGQASCGFPTRPLRR